MTASEGILILTSILPSSSVALITPSWFVSSVIVTVGMLSELPLPLSPNCVSTMIVLVSVVSLPAGSVAITETTVFPSSRGSVIGRDHVPSPLLVAVVRCPCDYRCTIIGVERVNS